MSGTLAYAARLSDWITRAAGASDSQFNELALELFRLQFQHNPVFRDLCSYRDLSPERIADWRQIPAVPTSAFKEFELTCLPPAERTRVFHSSGTTAQQPSRHFHSAESLELYEASLRPWFQTHVLPDHPRIRVLCLTPSAGEAPRSSLAHMGETILRAFGTPESSTGSSVDTEGNNAWSIELDRILGAFEAAIAAKEPLLIFGTAFSFVHLLDALAERGESIRLPTGSRVMETGGYKGRSRTLAKEELHQLICNQLGIAESHIICEYGMSELSSQAYDRVAGSHSPRVFRFPPWARVRILSPETGHEVADGECGLVQIVDLANAWSVMSVLTEDLGRKCGEGFELVGRAALAESRGCSLMLK